MKPDDAEPAARRRRPIWQLWSETVEGARATVQAELALVRAETAHNFRALRWSVAKIGVGMLFLMAALTLATVAVALWLTKAIGAAPTLLLLGLVYLLIGALLVRSGAAGVSLRRIMPARSLARLSWPAPPAAAGESGEAPAAAGESRDQPAAGESESPPATADAAANQPVAADGAEAREGGGHGR